MSYGLTLLEVAKHLDGMCRQGRLLAMVVIVQATFYIHDMHFCCKALVDH